MKGTLITSTPRGHMHPLAVQGILVTHCHAQILDWLSKRLDPAFSLLFAEPVFDEARDVVDWYTQAEGKVMAVADLAPEKRAQVLQAMTRQATAISDAVALEANTAAEGGRGVSGEIVKLALQYPDPGCLYLVGEHPVMVSWGYGPSTVGAEPQDLTRAGKIFSHVDPGAVPVTSATASPVAPLAVPGSSSEPTRLGWWLSWLLALVLLSVLLLLLWALATHNVPRLFDFVGRPLPGFDRAELIAAGNRSANLQEELQRLLTRLRERKALCVPGTASKTKPIPGQTAQAPISVPAPAPAKEGLKLPEKHVQDDMSFIEGEWLCATGLQNTSGDPIVVVYAFDAKGGGNLALSDGTQTCKAKAKASMNENVLQIITDPDILCSSGGKYAGQQIQCTGFGAQTQCEGRNMSDGERWAASFVRK